MARVGRQGAVPEGHSRQCKPVYEKSLALSYAQAKKEEKGHTKEVVGK